MLPTYSFHHLAGKAFKKCLSPALFLYFLGTSLHAMQGPEIGEVVSKTSVRRNKEKALAIVHEIKTGRTNRKIIALDLNLGKLLENQIKSREVVTAPSSSFGFKQDNTKELRKRHTFPGSSIDIKGPIFKPVPAVSRVSSPKDLPITNIPLFDEDYMENSPLGSSVSYLTQLENAVNQLEGGLYSSPNQVVITGMPGIGKTALALAYARKAYDKGHYKLIYLFQSGSKEKLLESYKNLLIKFNIRCEKGASPNTILDLMSIPFQKGYPYLLIYDNVPDYYFPEGNIPQMGGHIIITSRCCQGWDHPTVQLSLFSPSDAAQFLLERANVDSSHKEEGLALGERLRYLPLALSTAANYIKNKRLAGNSTYDFATYQKEFEEENLTLLPSSTVASSSSSLPVLDYDYFVKPLCPLARKAMKYFARDPLYYLGYLDPENLLRRPFYDYFDNDMLDEFFAYLWVFSILNRVTHKEDFTYSMHPLIQRAMRQKQEQGKSAKELYKFFKLLLGMWEEYKETIEDECVKENDPKTLGNLRDIDKVMGRTSIILSQHFERLSKRYPEERQSTFDVLNSRLEAFQQSWKSTISQPLAEIFSHQGH